MRRSRSKVALTAAKWALLCASFGSVTSVVVAWVAALACTEPRLTSTGRSGAFLSRERQSWIVWSTRSGPGTLEIMTGTDCDGGPTRSCGPGRVAIAYEMRGTTDCVEIRRPPAEIPGIDRRDINSSDFAFGWPTKNLWCESPMTVAGCFVMNNRPVEHVLKFRRSWLGLAPRVPFSGLPDGLPTGVLTRGMLVNTATYAAAWFGLLFVPARIRRRMAAKTGLCPACRYDLRGLTPGAPCPECGTPRNR